MPTFNTLVAFDGTNGAQPYYGGLTLDAGGNLYGTTSGGGTNNVGVVFKISAGSYTYTTLASFPGGNEAGTPYAGVVVDAAGNLYGTTNGFGPGGYGTVYKIAAGSSVVTTLHSFDSVSGARPYGGLVLDAAGNLFGTATYGGSSGVGTAFQIAAGSNAFTTLFNFDNSNGTYPVGGLIADAAGNLYGTTYSGGPGGSGTVFEITAGSHTFTSLASFNGGDGTQLYSGVVHDAAGNLFGTAVAGGAGNSGVVYEIAAGSNTVTVLHAFDNAEGGYPYGGVILDAAGNLFGTTSAGGPTGSGTIYKIAAGSHVLTTLYSFDASNDGQSPYASLAADAVGTLFGVTSSGGPNGLGTVFRLSDAGFVPFTVAPVAKTEALTVSEDGPPLVGNVLANDTDANADALRVTAFTVEGSTYAASGVATLASGATFSVSGNGAVTLNQDGHYRGLGTGDDAVLSFSYAITDRIDATGLSATVVSTLTIQGVDDAPVPVIPVVPVVVPEVTIPSVNHAPIVGTDAGALTARTMTSGNLLLNDHDLDAGDALHVAAIRFPSGLELAIPATGTVNVDGNHGVLTVSANGSFSYRANALSLGTTAEDHFTAIIADDHGGTTASALTASITGALPLGEVEFGFSFADASVVVHHGATLLTGPDGVLHDVTGVGVLRFADGIITRDDSAPLVDDLFYYASNRDVFAAGVDADTHYAEFGWREGRDPNAFFSTGGYLAANPDVVAGGTNPLTHYDKFGWHEGRDPGTGFSSAAYTIMNSDVAAAGMDPLAHYLAHGQGEGRTILPSQTSSSGPHLFDAAFYFSSNPDLAAAVPATMTADAFAFSHYLTQGWREGRDPDALFSTSGYLAAHPDVAATGVNPLLHYDGFGWREGRDPGPDFSSNGYLAAHAELIGTGTNPLEHYLQHSAAQTIIG